MIAQKKEKEGERKKGKEKKEERKERNEKKKKKDVLSKFWDVCNMGGFCKWLSKKK
jgi:hypothetical protein